MEVIWAVVHLGDHPRHDLIGIDYQAIQHHRDTSQQGTADQALVRTANVFSCPTPVSFKRLSYVWVIAQAWPPVAVLWHDVPLRCTGDSGREGGIVERRFISGIC